MKLQDPLEILNEIKTLKRCEANVSTGNIRKQLYSLQYNPAKETANEFLNKFEDLVRTHDNLPETKVLPEDEKKDALFNSVMRMLPEIQSVQFLTRSTKGKDTTYDEIKLFMIQAEANKKQNSGPTNRAVLVARRQNFERCYECDDMGHYASECPRKGTGLKKCYNCNMFVNHKANSCPKRREQPNQNYSYENSERQNKRYKFPKRSVRNLRGKGVKRKGNDNDGNCDVKRPKTAQTNQQFSKKSKNSKPPSQQNLNRSDNSSNKGEKFYFTQFQANFATNKDLNESDNIKTRYQ